ncbi:MAG: protein kinase [Pseudomonadota bacterium]|nr:MAG: protein kinase [Pseudomonadota bacterium]
MPLFLDTGHASVDTRQHRALEHCYASPPTNEVTVSYHGALLALADGLTDRPDAQGAAADAVNTLVDSYFKSPEAWPLERALRESFYSTHRKVRAGQERGRAAALSALVLRDQHWLLGHVGDTRVWRLRDNELKVLSRDHIEPRVGQHYAVSRACGLEEELEIEISSGELATGDIYLLTSDDVHGALPGSQLLSCLLTDASAQQAADCAIRQAIVAGASGDLSVCVVRVEAVPENGRQTSGETLTRLPVIDPPAVGVLLDGFRIEALVHKSRLYHLYRAVDLADNSHVVLKFPNPMLARSERFVDSFFHEEWIAKRVKNPHLVEPLALAANRRSALYSVMPYHRTENLSRRVRRKDGLRVSEASQITGQLLEALDQLHREGIIHHDVRPKNLLYDKRKKFLLLTGLGSSYIHALGDTTASVSAVQGSASYRAPELFAGAPPSVQTDVYAAGVTYYRLLTDHYPYGYLKGHDHPPSGEMVPPSHHKPDLPNWLEEVLSRACALNPAARYQSAREFAQAIVTGRALREHKPGPASASVAPVATRSRIKWWEWAFVALLLSGLAGYILFALRS